MSKRENSAKVFLGVMCIVVFCTLYRLEQNSSALDSLNQRARAVIALVVAVAFAYTSSHEGWRKFVGRSHQKLGTGQSQTVSRVLTALFGAITVWQIVVILTSILSSSPVVQYWAPTSLIAGFGFLSISSLGIVERIRPIDDEDIETDGVDEYLLEYRKGEYLYDSGRREYLTEGEISKFLLTKNFANQSPGPNRPTDSPGALTILRIPSDVKIRKFNSVSIESAPELVKQPWGYEAPSHVVGVFRASVDDYRLMVEGAADWGASATGTIAGGYMKRSGERLLFLKRKSILGEAVQLLNSEDRGWYNLGGNYIVVAMDGASKAVGGTDFVKYDATTWVLLQKGQVVASGTPRIEHRLPTLADGQATGYHDTGATGATLSTYDAETFVGSMTMDLDWRLTLPKEAQIPIHGLDPGDAVIVNALAVKSATPDAGIGPKVEEAVKEAIKLVSPDSAVGHWVQIAYRDMNANISASVMKIPAEYSTALERQLRGARDVKRYLEKLMDNYPTRVKDAMRTAIIPGDSIFKLSVVPKSVSFPLLRARIDELTENIRRLESKLEELSVRITSEQEDILKAFEALPQDASRSLTETVTKRLMQAISDEHRRTDERSEQVILGPAATGALGTGRNSSSDKTLEDATEDWQVLDNNSSRLRRAAVREMIQKFLETSSGGNEDVFESWLEDEGYVVEKPEDA